jgi:hypothetical protein
MLTDDRYKQDDSRSQFQPSLNPGKQAVFIFTGHLFHPLQENDDALSTEPAPRPGGGAGSVARMFT